MATIRPSRLYTGLAAFRDTLPAGTGDAPTADRLCGIAVAQHLAKGARLAPDCHADRLVYLVSGAAKLVASTDPGGHVNQVLAFHFGGDLMSVLRQSDGDLRLIGLTDCELVIFPTDRFLDIAQGDPAVLRAVLARALQALHHSRTRMMQLGHKSASARVADFLVSMAESLADCTAGACAFALPMSRRDIGDSLGLTIETVSRQLSELRQAGLVVTVGRSKICLRDIAALARIAGRQTCAIMPVKPG